MAAGSSERIRGEVEIPEGMDASPSDYEYQEQILQGVSRSFALTIPQLPGGLRSVVTNAYLLCRIADTIEDEGELPVEKKRFFFGEFINVIRGTASAQKFSGALFPLLSGNTLPAERDLVRNTPRVLGITHGLSKRQRAILERCVTIMSEGMLRFQEERDLYGLRGLGDLNKYCYHVAGVVGELLTELFCDYSKAIARRREHLLNLAVSFGQGLQMTNILKDLRDDEKRGACWLPRDIFQGFDCGGLSEHERSRAFSAGLLDLIGIAHAHLRNALNYSLLIPKRERGIRKFCLWAVGMAILTLQNINKRRDFVTGGEVKISRKALKTVIIATNVALRSNCLVRMLFYLLGRGLPISSVNP
jgi:farnesyl-diphosphate farnesyltransferase